MTFAADRDGHLFNLVVRGLAFHSGYLLVTRWVGGYCFPIGGRLEHGETLEDGVRREFQEETGVIPAIRKLVYFAETFFTDRGGRSIHELGWYFWVEAPDLPGDVDEVRPHPDHADLRLAYVSLDRLDQVNLLPRFLVNTLVQDFRRGFEDCPRRFVSRD